MVKIDTSLQFSQLQSERGPQQEQTQCDSIPLSSTLDSCTAKSSSSFCNCIKQVFSYIGNFLEELQDACLRLCCSKSYPDLLAQRAYVKICKGDAAGLQKLAQKGANLRAGVGFKEVEDLTECAIRLKRVECLKVLLQYDIGLNVRGETFEIFAVEENSPECLELLVQKDPNFNKRNNWSLAGRACDINNAECIRILGKHGLNVYNE